MVRPSALDAARIAQYVAGRQGYLGAKPRGSIRKDQSLKSTGPRLTSPRLFVGSRVQCALADSSFCQGPESPAPHSCLFLFVGLVRPKVRDRRLDSQEDSRDHEDPYVLLDEGGEIRPNDHPKKDATPLQRGDVNRRPHLGSENCHILHPCQIHLPTI
jgi:hypothetical protein